MKTARGANTCISQSDSSHARSSVTLQGLEAQLLQHHQENTKAQRELMNLLRGFMSSTNVRFDEVNERFDEVKIEIQAVNMRIGQLEVRH